MRSIKAGPVALAKSSSLVLAAAVLLATPTADAAFTDVDRCRDAMNNGARKAAALVVNLRARCLKQRMRHRLSSSVDCSADPATLGGPGTGDARTDIELARIARFRDQQMRKLEQKCKGVDLAASGIGDACSPAVTSTSELAECVAITLGKGAGDDLTELIDIPQQSTVPLSGARKCYEIVNRAIRNTVRRENALRAQCFKDAAKTGASYDCLATANPPGKVVATGYLKADAGLTKRYTQFPGNVRAFCEGIDFDSIGFQLIQSDPTAVPFTLEDLISNVYDAVLDESTVLIAKSLPSGPICGDGNVDAGEACDDGNRMSCDGCDRDCSLPTCGNGTGCSPEFCDDGNVAGGDGCDGSCISEICGNGIAQPGEQCDDGAGNSDTTPDACRTDCTNPSCGDGVIDTGEGCDPPNGIDCEPNCTSPSCGDGVVDPGEECDDGPGNNDSAPDACRVDCTNPSCGDGVVDTGEQCDPPDGGVTCKADCRFVTCGNGLPDPGEECDDGAGNSDTVPDACRTDCTNPVCGDGVTDPSLGESCDDGGESASCDDDCTAQSCGDGNTNEVAGEDCEDGNGTDGDGCDSNCTFTGCPNGILTTGETCDDGVETAACDDDCTLPACGDGNANQVAGEDCDDAGESAGCDADCTFVVCGDGTLNATAGEQCEDGNAVGGDGCSAQCTCEGGCQDPQCPGSGEIVLYGGVRQTPCTSDAQCIVAGAQVGTCDIGLGRCVTVTNLDTGWTGVGHNQDINDQVATRGILSCPGPFDGGSTEPCGACTVAGLDTSGSDLCRCSNDNRSICTQKFAPDAGSCAVSGLTCSTDDDCRVCETTTTQACLADVDCPGTEVCLAGLRQPDCINNQCVGTCDCYFGPPLPLSAGNVAVCALNKFANDVSGTANVDTGDGVIAANLATVVFTGERVVVPCPYCAGDVTFNDGVRDGTCAFAEDAGKPCDVQAPNLTFPSPSGDGHSLDCFPDIGKNVTGSGLKIDLVQTSGFQSITAGVSCGFVFNPQLCQCGVCSGNQSITCTNDTDCSSQGIGTCGLAGAGKPSANGCVTGDVCIDLGGGRGECSSGPISTFCDGVSRANGEPFVNCITNTECDATDCGGGAGPGRCGTCSLSRIRPCFLPTIEASGVADPQAPVGAAVFCVPGTSSSGVNNTAGLPGPGRVTNQARSRTFCASDPGVEYTPGVGGCP